jgi:hypothetical protein
VSTFEPITKPVIKATKDLEKGLSKTIVKPLTKVATDSSKALLKGVTAVLKPIDKLIRTTIGTPLNKASAFLSRMQKPMTKFFIEVMPNLSNLVLKLLPLAKTILKVLPLIGILLDILSAQTVTDAIKAQSKQIDLLNTISGNLQVKLGEQARILNRINAQLGTGGKVTATISEADRQAIVNAVVAQLRPAIAGQKVDLSGVNGQLSKISAQVAGVQAPKVDLSSVTAQLTQFNTGVTGQLSKLSAQVAGVQAPKVDLSPVTAQLTQINTQIARLPNPQEAISTAALSAAVVTALRPLIQQNQPDLNPVLSGLKQTNTGISTLNANVAQVNQRLNSPLTAIDPEVRATTTRIERQALANGQALRTVDDKLGTKISNGGLSGKLERLGKILQFDRIINMLTLITVLHNASMLASSLGQTLGSLTSEALAVIGLKDEDGSAIDINGILSKQANAFIVSIVGQEVWNGVQTNWNKANRVIASASNVIWTVRSLID